MKQTQHYTVCAYRTETKYNAKDDLISLLDVQVPADALEFLRAAHSAQDSKDVTFTIQVTNREDGEFRKLAFTSKGSKMKDFVPVATLEKWHNSHDNLTELFDHVSYELALIVQVRELQEGPGLFGEEPEAMAAGVLNAPKDVLALPAPEVEDAEFTPAEDTPEAFLARCSMKHLSDLLVEAGYDPTDWDDPKRSDEEDMAEWREIICHHWEQLQGTETLSEIRAQVEGEGHAAAAD
ncbi:hypothetical protein Dcar01_03555 [Deinococcus carri]|uniref:Uncharacterized protein n=1 Tax=Deinococcus carri TaxID=1211323 RepID=A0ABP9WBU6_9DEIO